MGINVVVYILFLPLEQHVETSIWNTRPVCMFNILILLWMSNNIRKCKLFAVVDTTIFSSSTAMKEVGTRIEVEKEEEELNVSVVVDTILW